METIVLTVLTVLAFIGLTYLASSFLSSTKTKISDMGYKLVLLTPHNPDVNLEGVVRQLYIQRIPEKLMTDGKIYIMIPNNETEALKIAESLKKLYPLEVLPNLSNVLYDNRERH